MVRITSAGGRDPVSRPLAVEEPVAIEIDGLGYAVMMATPEDLADFAAGFVLAERLAETMDDVRDVEAIEIASGILLRITLAAERHDRVLDRVRHRVAESSCGLCGIENLEQALRPLPCLPRSTAPDADAVFRALAALRDHQPLSRATGAVHGAALCAVDGAIRLVREDVGRHNAFDKLVGAIARGGLAWDGGFAITTARLSFELVEKAVLAGCPTVVAISAPTSLAVDRARAAGLRVLALARPDAMLEAVTMPG